MTRAVLSVVMCIMAVGFAGCQRCQRTDTATTASPVRVVIDELKRSVPLAGTTPQRIVSLSPEATELLFWLDVGPRVVGVARYSTYPPEAARLPQVGSYIDMNLEAVAALTPDLALATYRGNPGEMADGLSRLHIPVYVIAPEALADIPATLRGLVALLYPDDPVSMAMERRIIELQQRMDEAVRALRQSVRDAGLEGLTAAVLLQVEPPVLAGAETLLDDVVRAAGLHNIGADLPGRYPKPSVEALAARDPKVLVLIPMQDSPESRRITHQAIDRLPLRTTPRRCILPTDQSARATPRVVETLAAFAACMNLPAGNHP